MKKDPDHEDNVIHLLWDAYEHVETTPVCQYDDEHEMLLAKQEVLKILKRLIERRTNALQCR